MSEVQKLSTKILGEVISEEKQRFRFVSDAIFVVRQTSFICFINIIQAFDRVRLQEITALLNKKKIQPNLIEVIEIQNADNFTYVRAEHKLSNRMPVATSIR